MIIDGLNGQAKIFTDLVEDEAIRQVKELLDEPFTKGQTIRMMPDIHAGKGCVVGTTMTITDKVVPNLVGVDLGCGVYVGKIMEKEIDLAKLDAVIHEFIPAGFEVRENPVMEYQDLKNLKCFHHINENRALLSLGTLGGGNHFIELAKDEEGFHYLLIHTGSRSLGLAVAKYYQDIAVKELTGNKAEINEKIKEYKRTGKEKEISAMLDAMKSRKKEINRDLAYLEGESMENYLHDIDIAQKYAWTNRSIIADIISLKMNWTVLETFQTIHNYIDVEGKILRKGAVSAKEGEMLIIPMNMRDGSLICKGKGNADWNHSAPHGAGRIMSRNRARREIDMADYKKTMEEAGIYTSSVNAETLDEAPMAYKPMESILKNISDTVDVLKVIKPVYNFKASETRKF